MKNILGAMNRIGAELVQEKKGTFTSGLSAGSPMSLGRDLLSVLGKSQNITFLLNCNLIIYYSQGQHVHQSQTITETIRQGSDCS